MVTFTLNFDNQTCNQSAKDELFAKILEEKQTKKSGYYNLPYEHTAINDALNYVCENKDFLDSLSCLVIIGVGGSSLGLRAIDSMLRHLPHRRKLKLIFLEHTDPLHISKSLQHVCLQNTLFIAISKSGTTIETSSLLKYVIHTYDILRNADNKAHLLVVTDVNSPLELWAKQSSLRYFNISSNVGGRFSVLSAVGILPLAILNFDVAALLRGGADMAQAFFERRAEHILCKALIYATNSKKIPINVLFSYSSLFKHFNAWYVQLWGESLGKINAHGHKVGLTPIALIGSIDQHSFLQLIVQGEADKSVTFLGINPEYVKSPCIPPLELSFLETTNFVNRQSFATLLDNQRIATMQTIQNEGILTDCIEVMRLCEESVGMLVMYFELLTSCVGTLFEVDVYNQPGVEYGKQRLKALFQA